MGRLRILSYCKARILRALIAPARRVVLRKLDTFAASVASQGLQRSRHASPVAALALTLILCGCSGSSVIGLYAADYRDTTANAGDAQLLLNILRAKDNLPIHFYNLSNVHGSIQWNAGAAASAPFALNNSATPGVIAPLVGVQNNPSFDVGTSDTQDFTRGILSPLDPKVVKALFDQGVDPRIMLLLFFSGHRDSNGKVLLNTLACDPSSRGDPTKIECLNQVYDYFDLIDKKLDSLNPGLLKKGLRPKLQANIYSELNPVGSQLAGAWTLDNLDALRQIDTTKLKIIDKQLFSISEPRLAICYERGGTLHLLFPPQIRNGSDYRMGDKPCTQNEVIVFRPPSKHNTGLVLRSTYDIIQYLGQILRFQEEKGNNRCVTLTGRTEPERQCDTGEVLFQVNAPVGTPVIGTSYRDGRYALYDRSCNKILQQPCDYSIQVLAVLELLLNENSQSKDIIATPRVQVVQ